MPFKIIRDDITKVNADAIVNAANSSLLGGGGVDGAIHDAAGPELLEECRALGGCKTGQAKITKGYRLPAKYIIHTVGPIWHDGRSGEEKLLSDCYRNSLTLAKEYKLKSIAFPLISSGAYRYPKDKALRTAISVIGDFMLKHDMTVYLVVYDKASFMLSKKLFSSIAQYIDDNYIDEHPDYSRTLFEKSHLILENYSDSQRMFMVETPQAEVSKRVKKQKRSLNDVIGQMDETFSQALLRIIDEKGMTDAETYKKANIDRKHFSKIRNDVHYNPSKPTTIAFAVALELNLDETKDLLSKAGFVLSQSSKFDLIIQYFIEEGNYNIFEINEALFAFDQKLLGV